MASLWLGSVSNAEGAGFAFSVFVLLLAATQYFHRRQTPQEMERRRRSAIDLKGKLGNAEVTDFEGDTIVYSYRVAGVAYTASQDISELKDRLPEDPSGILGPASVKFIPRNPANSIVLSEEWSGLRSREMNGSGPHG